MLINLRSAFYVHRQSLEPYPERNVTKTTRYKNIYLFFCLKHSLLCARYPAYFKRKGRVIDIHLFHFFFFLWALKLNNARYTRKRETREKSSREKTETFKGEEMFVHELISRKKEFISISFVVLEADYVNPPKWRIKKKRGKLRNLDGAAWMYKSRSLKVNRNKSVVSRSEPCCVGWPVQSLYCRVLFSTV